MTSKTVAEDDAIGSSLRQDNERRIVTAVQWHNLDDTKVRIFLGLRLPSEAEGVLQYPEYRAYRAALDDADVGVAIQIARDVGPDRVFNLLQLAESRVSTIAARQPDRAINPAVIGFHLLSEFHFSQREQMTFLNSLVPLTQPLLMRRVTPSVAAEASVKVSSEPHAMGIRAQLVEWFGASNDPIQDEVVDAIGVIHPQLTPEELSTLRGKVDEALSADIAFEHRLRRLPDGVGRGIIQGDSVDRLIDIFSLPEDPDEMPNTQPALETIRAHASLYNQDHLTRLSARAEPWLIARSEAGIPLDEVDLQTITQVLQVATAADLTPIDVFAPLISHRLDANQAETYQVLAERASEIETLLAGEARNSMVKLVSKLIRGETPLAREDALDIAAKTCAGYSGQSRGNVLKKAVSLLGSTDDEQLLEFTLELGQSVGDISQLNNAALERSATSPNALGWLRDHLASKISTNELRLVFKGAFDGMVQFLEATDTYVDGAAQLRNLPQFWNKTRAQRIIDLSDPHLESTDPSVVAASAKLISEAIRQHEPKNASLPRNTAVDLLSNGPLSLDSPDEMFDFQVESLQHVEYAKQIQVRGLVRDGLQTNDIEIPRLFTVAHQLIEVSPNQHSDALFRPTVDYALTVEDETARGRALALLDVLQPSSEEIERNREGLAQLGPQLPGKFEEHLKSSST